MKTSVRITGLRAENRGLPNTKHESKPLDCDVRSLSLCPPHLISLTVLGEDWSFQNRSILFSTLATHQLGPSSSTDLIFCIVIRSKF
jgi:hypothetical protein